MKSIGEVARRQVLRVAFPEDVMAAMLSRWVSELEPMFVIDASSGRLIGITHEGDWNGEPMAIIVSPDDLRIEEIADHYERRRRRSRTHLQLVENS